MLMEMLRKVIGKKAILLFLGAKPNRYLLCLRLLKFFSPIKHLRNSASDINVEFFFKNFTYTKPGCDMIIARVLNARACMIFPEFN